ncbi:MAG TPA: glycosyltransferase [Solirubrobacterales bacterium]|nr:glycosyltransferase [Solirubrobacterales bacterium]
MTRLQLVEIEPAPLERFRPLIADRYDEVAEAAARACKTFSGRRIWHVNSTAQGGGVAEMLRALLPYARDAGVDTRWAVLMPEAEEFFAVTKRIHNHLHGDEGDGGELDDAARAIYEGALSRSADELRRLVEPEDVIYLHDPQTAGLVPAMQEAGPAVIWRCHVGVDRPNDLAREAWEFLRPYVERADAYVFSRREYLWEGLDQSRAWFMPPVIDPFSAKNEELDGERVAAVLSSVGAKATILEQAPVPESAPVVAQVSRWDRLKDPRGLLEVFEHHLDEPSAHLVLVGPETAGVSDDPEGAAVYGEVAEHWRGMSAACRARSHLISLPMTDLRENATMVNALQRRAGLIVQKSLAEGFGLTVAEAMWKARPVVASGVGGIRDQVVDGRTGILVDDPRDLPAFASAIESILGDRDRCSQMGEAGRERVRGNYLAVDRLREYVGLVAALLARIDD